MKLFTTNFTVFKNFIAMCWVKKFLYSFSKHNPKDTDRHYVQIKLYNLIKPFKFVKKSTTLSSFILSMYKI